MHLVTIRGSKFRLFPFTTSYQAEYILGIIHGLPSSFLLVASSVNSCDRERKIVPECCCRDWGKNRYDMRQTLTLRSSLCSLFRQYCSMAAAASSSLLRCGTTDPSFKLDKKLIRSFFDSSYNRTNFTRRMSIMVCSDNRDRLIERTEQKNIHHRHYRRSHNRIDSLNSSAFAVDSDVGTNACDAALPAASAAARLANGHGSACHRGSTEVQSNHKIVVAVDVDEVLGNFVSALNRFIADRYSSDHSVSEYYVYEFFRIWNCTRDEADIRVHEFFKTPYFKKGIHPIPGALQALQKVSSFCNLSVVTSRQNAIREHTIQWIGKHYPGLFQEIHFGNHFALEGQSRPKSDICRSLGAKVLIDDNPRYAMECAEVGIRVLLFDYKNSYPWCKLESVDQHPLVTKVHTWDEVEHQLISWMFHQSFTFH